MTSQQCTICHQLYKDATSLHKHIEHVHKGRSILCGLCGAIIRHSGNWQRHVNTTHDSIPIDNCPYTVFYEEKRLQRQSREGNTPTLTCKKCGETFADKHQKFHHFEEVHRKRRFQCGTCHTFVNSFVFLPEHERKHKEETVFYAVFGKDKSRKSQGKVR